MSAVALFLLLTWAPWEDLDDDGCLRVAVRVLAMIGCLAFTANAVGEAVQAWVVGL